MHREEYSQIRCKYSKFKDFGWTTHVIKTQKKELMDKALASNTDDRYSTFHKTFWQIEYYLKTDVRGGNDRTPYQGWYLIKNKNTTVIFIYSVTVNGTQSWTSKFYTQK
jgi:hypothetical protein